MSKSATSKLTPLARGAAAGAELVDTMLREPNGHGPERPDGPVEEFGEIAPAQRRRADARADSLAEMLEALEAEETEGAPPSFAQTEDGVTLSAVMLPDSLVEEARNAAAYLSQPPEQLTVEQVVEFAVRRDLARLRREHLGGRMFPTSKIFRRRLRDRKKTP